MWFFQWLILKYEFFKNTLNKEEEYYRNNQFKQVDTGIICARVVTEKKPRKQLTVQSSQLKLFVSCETDIVVIAYVL